MNPDPMEEPTSQAGFFAFAYQLIESILANAGNPSAMNRLLVEQLRELTGARLVVLARHIERETGGCNHELAAVEPERRRTLAETPATMALLALSCEMPGPVLWERGTAPSEAEAALQEQSLPGPTVVVPLRVGGNPVGALLLFGLPDKHSLDQVLDVLGTLARVVALVLRNATLYEDQEDTIAARTRDLAESQERLEVTLRSIGDAVIAVDSRSRVSFMNAVAEELTGWEEDEALGRSIEDVFSIINEESRQPVESPVARVLREGKIVGLANHSLLLARDGREIPIADSGSPIMDAREEMSGVVLIFRDQTTERLAQKLMRESENLLRKIAENYPNSYLSIIEADYTIGFTSGQEFRKRNLDPEQYIGLTLDQVFGEHAAIIRAYYEKTFAGEGQSFELLINEQDLHYRTVPLYGDDGSILRILAVVENITERKQAEQELQMRVRQQAGIAGLGRQALAGIELSTLMDEAVELVAGTLQVEFCKVLELLPDGSGLLLRAGIGWKDGLIGRATVGADMDSQAGYTLFSREPVIVHDLRTETRFSGPPLLNEHHIVSGVSVMIQGPERPYGVMGAHTTQLREFTQDDTHFLQGVANLLAESIRHQRVKEALQRSNQRYSQLVEFAPVAIAVHSGGKLVFVNPAAVRLMGAQGADDLVGKSVLEVVHPDSRELARHRIEQALETGDTLPLAKEKFFRLDGATIDVETIAQPISFDGQLAIQVIVRDITKRIRAEKALEQRAAQLALLNQIGGQIAAERELKSLLEQAVQLVQTSFGYHHVALFTIDDEHQVVVMETRAGLFDALFPPHHQLEFGQGLVGWAAEHNQVILANDTDTEPRYTNLFAGVIPTQSEIALPVCVEGEVVGVLDVQSPHRNAFDESDVLVLKTLADQIAVGIENARLLKSEQTHSAQLEQRVEERTRELRDAQGKLIRSERLAVLGELAGGVGHELRNPLGVITNAVYYLNMVLSGSDVKTREYLDLIDSEAKNAARIVAQLLDLAHIQSAAQTPVEIPVLITEVLARCPAPENVALSVVLPEDLPPIYVDPDQIKQVIANMVMNAYQAMPEGGRLTVSSAWSGSSDIHSPISFFIRDTGEGIAPENMDILFEPLFTTRPKGIGLGLAISKRLVEANNGQVLVESRLGAGTTMTLVFSSVPLED